MKPQLIFAFLATFTGGYFLGALTLALNLARDAAKKVSGQGSIQEKRGGGFPGRRSAGGPR